MEFYLSVAAFPRFGKRAIHQGQTLGLPPESREC
jgi:hypothetical protein